MRNDAPRTHRRHRWGADRLTQAGDTVGSYQLIRELGEGPFGVVWQARDARRTPLAIKLLRPSFIQRPAGQAAFTRLLAAIRAHEMIQHDGIARLYGAVQDAEHPAYGMVAEYVDGRLLSDIRMQSGLDAKSLSVVLAWFEQLGEVLAWLHVQGIIHGNLKPNNIKLVRESYGHRIKLLDLPWSAIGLAAPAEGEPSYLAPEQLRGAPPSTYSDQWSLATMLSEVLRAAGGPTGPAQLPPNLSMVLQRAHHPEPAYRYAQLMEFVGALRVVRSELSMPGSGVYGAMHAPYGPYGPGPGGYTPSPFAPPAGPMAGGQMSTGQIPVMPPAGMTPAESSIPGATRVPPNLYASPRPGASGGPATGATGYGPAPSFGNDDDPVFVPTARPLETTLGGSLPETGEHEALNVNVFSGQVPEPVVTDGPKTNDKLGYHAPMFGAPTLPSIPKSEQPKLPKIEQPPPAVTEPLASAKSVPAAPSTSNDQSAVLVETPPPKNERSTPPPVPNRDNEESGSWETHEVGEVGPADAGSGADDTVIPAKIIPGQPAPVFNANKPHSEKNGAAVLPADPATASYVQDATVIPVRPDADPPHGAAAAIIDSLDPADPVEDDAVEAVSADPELEAWAIKSRTDTLPLNAELDEDGGKSSRWWPYVLVAGLLVVAVLGAGARYLQLGGLPLGDNPANAATDDSAGSKATARAANGVREDDPTPKSPAPVEQLRGDPSAALAAGRGNSPTGDRRPGDGDSGGSAGPQGPGAPDADDDASSSPIEDAQVGCDEGDGNACLEVARHYESIKKNQAAQDAAKRACTFGAGAGCLAAGRVMASQPKSAFPLFSKGCELGAADACHEASTLVRAGSGVRRDLSRAARLAKRACDLGRQASCARQVKTSTRT